MANMITVYKVELSNLTNISANKQLPYLHLVDEDHRKQLWVIKCTLRLMVPYKY